MNKILKAIWFFFLDFIETIVIALAIFVLVYRFLFQPHQVKGNSMYDNFLDGEYLLTDKISYQFNPPQHGDVVVFKAPRNEDYDYIKRIIAIPGEKVMIKDKQVYINNQLIDESGYLEPSTFTKAGTYAQEGLVIGISTEEYFVLGDNRNNSSDSREWGLVPLENIIGKTWIRYWPLNKIDFIKKYPKAKLQSFLLPIYFSS